MAAIVVFNSRFYSVKVKEMFLTVVHLGPELVVEARTGQRNSRHGSVEQPTLDRKQEEVYSRLDTTRLRMVLSSEAEISMS